MSGANRGHRHIRWGAPYYVTPQFRRGLGFGTYLCMQAMRGWRSLSRCSYSDREGAGSETSEEGLKVCLTNYLLKLSIGAICICWGSCLSGWTPFKWEKSKTLKRRPKMEYSLFVISIYPNNLWGPCEYQVVRSL